MFLLVKKYDDHEEYYTDIRFNVHSFITDVPDGDFYKNMFFLTGHNNSIIL